MRRPLLALVVTASLAVASLALAGNANVVPPVPANTSETALLAVQVQDCNFLVIADVGVCQDTAGVTSASNGVTVGYWADQSPYARNLTQVTASAQPRFATNVVNGHSVVRFNSLGTNSATTTAHMLTGDTEYQSYSGQTVICACSTNWATVCSGTTASYYAVAGHNDSSFTTTYGDGFFCVTGQNTGGFALYGAAGFSAGYGAGNRPRATGGNQSTLNNGSWHVFTWRVGPLSDVRLDGAAIGTTVTGGACSSGNGWIVGTTSINETTLSRGWLGDIYFLAHYTRVLDTHEVRTVEKFVAGKLGINAGA